MDGDWKAGPKNNLSIQRSNDSDDEFVFIASFHVILLNFAWKIQMQEFKDKHYEY